MLKMRQLSTGLRVAGYRLSWLSLLSSCRSYRCCHGCQIFLCAFSACSAVKRFSFFLTQSAQRIRGDRKDFYCSLRLKTLQAKS